ncbi:MAG: hypothetical protein KGM47_18025 [Acidobacteriota bacterium]|nr:hypothetical protein [Acidobacteriota bacterium]
MPYQISQETVDKLGQLLASYYEEAWQAGVKGLFDNMARANMGVVTGYLDVASDTFANLRKKSADSFFTTFKPTLKQQVALYFANRSDVATDLVNIGEKAIAVLASKIPVPYLGKVVTALVGLGANEAREELHQRSIQEADKQLAAKTGAAPQKFFTTDTEAAEFVKKSIDQYKTIAKYIETLPKASGSFDDAITFPASVFKVQQAASSLNVALVSIHEYLESMAGRLSDVQNVSKQYIQTVRTTMPAAVRAVLDRSYADGYGKGKQDIDRKKYSKPGIPKLQAASKPGGASQLAVYVAHALAQGYYDSGNTGPQIGPARLNPPGRI